MREISCFLRLGRAGMPLVFRKEREVQARRVYTQARGDEGICRLLLHIVVVFGCRVCHALLFAALFTLFGPFFCVLL
jgi:hypothetical protein